MKSDKLDKAIAKVESKDATQALEKAAERGMSFVQDANPDELNQELASGQFEVTTLVTLKEGQTIKGILVGKGETKFDDMDVRTGVVVTRLANTWLLEVAPGIRVSLLGAAALDRQLEPAMDRFVKIYRGKETKTRKNMNLTEYLVLIGKDEPKGENLLNAGAR
jgi:hypothetical protein